MAANPYELNNADREHIAAECYAAVKGSVVLLGVKSKRPPVLENGKCMRWKGVSVRLDELIKHIRNDGNYGIKTGSLSGLDICDIDAPEDYPELVDRLKTLTPYTQTGGGGFHFWFKHHARVKKNRTAALRGIDVKTTDGYAVAPGSVHDETGVIYELFGRLEDAVEWPVDLLDMLFPDTPGRSPVSNPPAPLPPDSVTPYAAKALVNAIDAMRTAPEGQRNDTLNREAFGLGGLSHLGLDRSDVEESLVQAALAAGLSESEARTTFHSGWEKGTISPRTIEVSRPTNGMGGNLKTRKAKDISLVNNDTRTHIEPTEEEWPDPQPAVSITSEVPIVEPEMLPHCLRDWIFDAADRMQTAPDYMAVSACVMMGSLIGRQVSLRPKQYDTSWTVTPNIWGALVGQSSMMKTPAITETRKILDKLDREYIAGHEVIYKQWEVEYHQYKASLKYAEKKAEKEASEEKRNEIIARVPECPEAPERRRIYTNDATIEKLQSILKGSPQGVLILRDELTGWLRTFDKKGHESDRPFYLEGYGGNGRYCCDRIGRGTIIVEGLCLGVLGGATPGGMESFVKDALGNSDGSDGLLQRFNLIAYPSRLDDFSWTDRLPDEKAFFAAETGFRRCANIDLSKIGAETGPYPGILPFLRFEPEAQELFKEWFSDLQVRMRRNDEHHALESHLLKQDKLVCGLSLIFHVVSGNSGAVGTTSLLQAIRWAEYAEAHARKLYGVGSPAANLLKHIERGDLESRFTARDVVEKGWSGLTIAETVGDALDNLVETGHIRAVKTTGRGRPTITYSLHPQYRRKQQ